MKKNTDEPQQQQRLEEKEQPYRKQLWRKL